MLLSKDTITHFCVNGQPITVLPDHLFGFELYSCEWYMYGFSLGMRNNFRIMLKYLLSYDRKSACCLKPF